MLIFPDSWGAKEQPEVFLTEVLLNLPRLMDFPVFGSRMSMVFSKVSRMKCLTFDVGPDDPRTSERYPV